jgi:SAM-dependent methyltransferase
MRPAVATDPAARRDAEPAASAAACPLCRVAMRPWCVKAGRHLVRCPSCRLIVVREGLALTRSGVSIYEADDESVFRADGNEGYYLDHETNLQNSRRKLAWVAHELPAGARLVDAGSNFGHFLAVARERYAASGFDVSPMAVAAARERFGVESIVASVYALPASLGSADAVTCWDVIEHLPDPLAALRALRALLRPGGLLFLSTPDAGSPVARVLGRRWHYLDPVQHITVFGRANLGTALARAGFAVVRVGSLGHDYRVRYVFDRLAYLHRRGVLGGAVAAARALARPLGGRSIHLDLGDVAIVTAVRTEAAT